LLGLGSVEAAELLEEIAIHDERGTSYDAHEVEKLREKRERAVARIARTATAEQEAQAFEKFEEGLDVVATTIALRLRPAHAADLHAQYTRHRAVLVVGGSTLAELAGALDIAPADLTPTRLLELVTQLRERLRLRRRHEAGDHGHGEARPAGLPVAHAAGAEPQANARAVPTRASAFGASGGD